MDALLKVKQLVEQQRWLEVATSLTQINKLDISLLIYRAQAHFQLHHFHEAKKYFDQILEIIFNSDSNYSLTLIFRVGIRCIKCYTHLGLYKDALKLIDKTIALIDPMDIEARALYLKAKEDINRKLSFSKRSFIERTDEFDEVMDMYKENQAKGIQEGSWYYLISASWIDKWQHWVKSDRYPYPGPINNVKLIKQQEDYVYPLLPSKKIEENYTTILLQSDMKENEHYFVVSEEVIDLFQQRYGLMQTIKRKGVWMVHEDENFSQEVDESLATQHKKGKINIDVWILSLRVMIQKRDESREQLLTINISKHCSVRDLQQRVLQLYDNASLNILTWSVRGKLAQTVLRNKLHIYQFCPEMAENIDIDGIELGSDLLLRDLEIGEEDLFFFEIRAKDQTSLFTTHSNDEKEPDELNSTRFTIIIHEYMGKELEFAEYAGNQCFKNEGNGCFLEAALHCLAATKQLTFYFLTQRFCEDMNIDNSLGSGGRIAISYYYTMKDLWMKTVQGPPKILKEEIKRKAGYFFSGYKQDSGEIVAFLIDALHEDMNTVSEKTRFRITQGLKKQRKKEESKEGPNPKQAWKDFKLLNHSFLVNLFYGQLESTIKCSNCIHKNVSWEPFSVLSLPIPKFTEMNFLFVKRDGSLFELNRRISDRTSFLDLAIYAQEFKQLGLDNIHDVLPTSVHNFQTISKIFNPLDTIYRFKQILQSDRLVFYHMQEEEVRRLNTGELETIEIRVSQEHHRKIKICPRLMTFNPKVDTVNELRKLVFDVNQKYFSPEEQKSARQSFEFEREETQFPTNRELSFIGSEISEYDREATYSIDRRVQFNIDGDDMDQVESAKMQQEIYDVCIMGTIVEKKDFLKRQYICGLTGNQVIDPKRGSSLSIYQDSMSSGELLQEIKSKIGPNTRLKLQAIWPNKSAIFNPPSNHREVLGSPFINATTDLKDCLLAYQKEELLEVGNQYHCEMCDATTRSKKSLEIVRTGEALVIELKRMAMRSVKDGTLEKNNEKISIPLYNLEVAGNRYNLYAVLQNEGYTQGEHHIAVARNFVNGEWVMYGDKCDKMYGMDQELVTNTASVLFYARIP